MYCPDTVGAVLFGIFLLHVLKPVDFNQLLIKKLKGLGVHVNVDINNTVLDVNNNSVAVVET
jgi:hypothetical protein